MGDLDFSVGLKRAGAILVVALAGLALSSSPISAETKAPDPTVVRKAAAAADAGDCKTALRLLTPMLKSAEDMPDGLRAPLIDAAASCAITLQQIPLAYDYAVKGTAFDNASDWLWRMRLLIELDGKRTDAALATITAMTQGRGAALNSVPVKFIIEFDNAMRRSDNAAGRRRLLAMLVQPSYQPDEPVPVTDVFRRRYAELLYDAGEKEAALTLARQIDTPPIVMTMSVDPRFHAAVPSSYDARAATIAFLERLQEIASRHPESLDTVIEISSAQRRLGKPDLALATLQAGNPTVGRTTAFVDKDEKLNWWWDAVARAHEAADRYDEAVAAMRQGIGADENGQRNVSQTINLAEAQLRYGRPGDALETLAIFDREKMAVSHYGEMEMRFARGCAAKQAGKGDPSGDVAFTKAHATDHPQALGDLLLCIGDIDGAAAEFIARLDDPARRADALLELSDYDPPLSTAPADPVYSRIPALRARDDVKAAIARAGDVRKFNVQRGDL